MPGFKTCTLLLLAATYSLVAFVVDVFLIHRKTVVPIIPNNKHLLDDYFFHSNANVSSILQESSAKTTPRNPNNNNYQAAAAITFSKVDALCGGCRLTMSGPDGGDLSCIGLIFQAYQRIQKKKRGKDGRSTTADLLAEAGQRVAHDYPDCQRCDPNQCGEHDKTYWRLDQAGPTILSGRTHYIQSVPAQYRLPPLQGEEFVKHFENANNTIPNRNYLWEFNPVLVPLPPDQVPDNLGLDVNQPYYLAFIRLGQVNSCFNAEHQKLLDPNKKIYPGLELMAFCIMNTNLDILHETIVRQDPWIDQRIFNLQGQLYLGYIHRISPFWLKSPPTVPFGQLRRLPTFDNRNSAPFSITIRAPASCCDESEDNTNTCHGKNFNYFLDASTNQVMVETRPVDPHIVERVDMDRPCSHMMSKIVPPEQEGGLRNLLLQAENEQQSNKTTKAKEVHNNRSVEFSVPQESFFTTDEIYFSNNRIFQLPYTHDRGTACCVRIPDVRGGGKQSSLQDGNNVNNNYLWLGVSHTKTPHWKKNLRETHGVDFAMRQYQSRFYAFEPVAPYRVVARSGQFCLGYPDPNSTEARENPNNPLILDVPYSLGGVDYACPLITFVTGLIEAVDNSSQLIMSYGMNDCVPRMVKISKSEVVRMLFPEQAVMDATKK